MVDTKEEQSKNTSGMLTDIAYAVSKHIECDVDPVSNPPSGEALEKELMEVCKRLGSIGCITNNHIDVDFLLMITASYLIAKEEGQLDEDVKPPSVLFEERIIPLINSTEEVVIEPISEEE